MTLFRSGLRLVPIEYNVYTSSGGAFFLDPVSA